ncbi:MAG: hypothetical protein HWN66_09395 [Candidatus Helarchaeota archaeon]|nr:hypothetical protein [Candidatus Helarchaeota archaeon]
MPQHTYGEIPDSIPIKKMIPIGEHIWRIIQEYGWDYYYKQISDPEVDFFPKLGDAVNEKFQTAVEAAKDVLDGKIKNPEKVFSTWFFPPLIYVRSDLQMGTTKLIYGDSTDITFVVMADDTSQVELLINGHMEDGLPADYWYIKKDDEIFDRRHMKLGIKLREIPNYTKDVMKSGFHIIDVLRDVRNERSPHWADSAYSICMVYVSGGINMSCDLSNWANLGGVWDGLSSKKIYGAPDYWFCYVPWPPLLGMLMRMGRSSWTVRMTGLLTNHQLFINAFEPKHKALFKYGTPELWQYLVNDIKQRGVATPKMTLDCTPPALKDKKKFINEEFDWIYPSGSRIMPFEWGLTEDEVFGGIITDITHETPPAEFYGGEHVLSKGIGKAD